MGSSIVWLTTSHFTPKNHKVLHANSVRGKLILRKQDIRSFRWLSCIRGIDLSYEAEIAALLTLPRAATLRARGCGTPLTFRYDPVFLEPYQFYLFGLTGNRERTVR